MSKYLDYDGLSHFKDKLDDNLKTNINPVISTTIDSKAVLTDETADITSLATVTVEQGDWVTSEGTDEADYETASGYTEKYYYGNVTYTVTTTLSETQEADTTVIIKVVLSYMSGIDVDDDHELVNYYTSATKNVTITIPAGETTGTTTDSYRSLSKAGTVTVSVVSATTSAYTEQQTLTVTHLDNTTNSYIFNGGSGTEVVANDGNTYSEDLNSLVVNGTGYNIPSGGNSGNYVTLDTEQTVTGVKKFTNNLIVGNASFAYDKSTNAVLLEEEFVITNSVTGENFTLTDLLAKVYQHICRVFGGDLNVTLSYISTSADDESSVQSLFETLFNLGYATIPCSGVVLADTGETSAIYLDLSNIDDGYIAVGYGISDQYAVFASGLEYEPLNTIPLNFRSD